MDISESGEIYFYKADCTQVRYRIITAEETFEYTFDRENLHDMHMKERNFLDFANTYNKDFELVETIYVFKERHVD